MLGAERMLSFQFRSDGKLRPPMSVTSVRTTSPRIDRRQRFQRELQNARSGRCCPHNQSGSLKPPIRGLCRSQTIGIGSHGCLRGGKNNRHRIMSDDGFSRRQYRRTAAGSGDDGFKNHIGRSHWVRGRRRVRDSDDHRLKILADAYYLHASSNRLQPKCRSRNGSRVETLARFVSWFHASADLHVSGQRGECKRSHGVSVVVSRCSAGAKRA